jgi:hypothetical protein
MPRFHRGLLGLVPALLLATPQPSAAEEKPEGGRLLASQASERPGSLLPLYVSYSALQALDAHSTFHGLSRGARESNPLMGGVSDSPAAFVAMKAGATAGTIYLTEKLWKRNRKAAIATMIGANIAYGFVVSHNYAVARRKPVQ